MVTDSHSLNYSTSFSNYYGISAANNTRTGISVASSTRTGISVASSTRTEMWNREFVLVASPL